jgi:hypothetical protein
MHFLAVVVLFPLLFWLLCCGCGLLAERFTGSRLPALLVIPVGFAVLVVVSQFTLWYGPTAPLTPFVLLALALVGVAAARGDLRERWRARSGGWWVAFVPAVATYVLVAAPVLAAGRLTFTGYLLDTTGAVQLAGAERILHHAHDFLPGVPAYGTTLTAYFGNSYPSGGHGVLASVGWLSGQDLIWLYTPFQALELGVAALGLTYLAKSTGLSRAAAAVTGTIAAAPALVYAYALMGSIKEITALPVLVLMGALLVCARELRRSCGVRAVIPFAVAAAAALNAIGFAASPWVAFFATAALFAAVPVSRRADLRGLALGGVVLAIATVVVALPTVGPLSKSLALAEGVSNSNAKALSDPGNLLRPLKFLQTLGIWLGETHRLEPKYVNQTYVLLGVAVVCVAFGLIWLIRRRAWSVLAFVAGSLIVWDFLHHHATPWTDAKLLVILSPVVVFLALVGAFGLMRARLLEGLSLVVLLSAGILLSDGLLYHGTNLAPTQRFTELMAINADFASQGPTLTPDFEEYTLYLLRDMQPDAPGLAYSGPFTFVNGVSGLYGHSYDLDSLVLPSIERFRTIVMRRSPLWSRPPGNFTLEWSGRYYTVWRRVGRSPRAHVGLAGASGPTAVPRCETLRSLGKRAMRIGARIAFVPRPQSVSADLTTTARSSLVGVSSDLEGHPQLGFGGPARVQGSFSVKATTDYEMWLGGDVDRPLHVIVDGRGIGAPAAQSGDDGTMVYVATIRLRAGRHSFQLVRGGGDLRPDDNGSTAIDGVIFEPVGAEDGRVQTVAAHAWHSLCGRELDWIEIV